MGALDIATLVPVALAMVATGVIAGIIAGLLGVGGGIVLVPVLEWMLQYAGVPEAWRMHVAVATSLATIIPTSISSSRAHHARGAVDGELARAWAVPMLLGALTGALLAGRLPAAVLSGLFGIVALLVAVKMLLPLDGMRLAERPPRGVGGAAIGSTIGAVSAMMGIGGGTLSVPAMTLSGAPIHVAVGTAAFFGLVISLPGTVGYLFAEPGVAMPWGTVGLVSLVGFLLVSPATWLTAPLGARIAHALSRRALSIAFGAFLALVGARMLWRAAGGG
jgi:uncharacterized membrane protein YfcA